MKLSRSNAAPDAGAATGGVCVVGSGWMFTSGISYYTCRLTSALSGRYQVSAVLMRRLIPRIFYPGRKRVGRPMHQLEYPADVPVCNGVDWFWVPSIFRAVAFLVRRRPAVVIFQWWSGAVLHSYVLLVAVARLLGASVVVEFHEIQDTGEARLFGAKQYLRAMSRWLLARSDAFVVHSEFDRRQVAATFAVSGRPLHVLPHGPFDHHVGETPVAATPAADGVTTVLFFGTIRPYKGLEHLVAAFNALTEDEARGLRLLIVGETWEGWDLPLELARRSPHADRIEIVNRYVHDDEISGFFARADAVALPYTRSSASGPLHIAMAFGRPIVLTDVGGLRDGAAGYAGITWVPPNDEAALTEALRALPAVRGMRYPDVRSWDDTVQTYEKLIGELGIDPAASPRPSAAVPEPAS